MSQNEVTELTLDFNDLGTQGKNQRAQEELKARCYLCGTQTIGIWDTVSPCCELPIVWLNHPRLEKKLLKQRTDRKAAAKRDEKLDYLLPGTRYLVEQARTREDAALGQKPGTSKVLPMSTELSQLVVYEGRYGEQFIRDLTDSLDEYGRALIVHARNRLPFAAQKLSTKPVITETKPNDSKSTLELTDEARNQLGLK